MKKKNKLEFIERSKRVVAFLLATVMVLSLFVGLIVPTMADSLSGYLVLGADLSEDQKKTVLQYLDVADEAQYNVSYCTNEQEHEAFDSYLPSSVIGSKAYSSILMIPADEDSGITVQTYNISYVTVSMYQNALITAGVSDVNVRVAAPFSVSGTCALVSAMNAYTIMTGEEISEDAADAATDELVTTGDVGDAIGDNDRAAEVMATLKQQVAESDEEMTDEDLEEAVNKVCVEFKITLDDDLKKEIIAVLQKLQQADTLDADTLKTQAKGLYDKISASLDNLGIDETTTKNFFEKLMSVVKSFFSSIGDYKLRARKPTLSRVE